MNAPSLESRVGEQVGRRHRHFKPVVSVLLESSTRGHVRRGRVDGDQVVVVEVDAIGADRRADARVDRRAGRGGLAERITPEIADRPESEGELVSGSVDSSLLLVGRAGAARCALLGSSTVKRDPSSFQQRRRASTPPRPAVPVETRTWGGHVRAGSSAPRAPGRPNGSLLGQRLVDGLAFSSARCPASPCWGRTRRHCPSCRSRYLLKVPARAGCRSCPR